MNDVDGVTAGERADATLLLALRAGEGWAPKAIWDRHSGRVRRFFARAGRKQLDEMEDLTQDVFLRVFSCQGGIQKPESLRHFVMSVARNVLSRQLRYQYGRRSVSLSATGAVPDIPTPPRGDDEARHTLRQCYEVLARIRTRERTAFGLRYLEGMSNEQVAERLGTSSSTAKRLIRRAANKVSAKLTRSVCR